MKFQVGDKVKIKELDVEGIVMAAFISRRNWEYEVRYFNQGKAELVYFFENELDAIKE